MKSFWSGSAKKLQGKCLVVGIFFSEPDKPWTEEGRKNTWKNVKNAMKWIQKNSEDYDIDLEFEYKCMNEDEDVVLDKIPSFEDPMEEGEAAIIKVLEELDFESPGDFYTNLKEEYEEYSLHVMFFANKDDRAYMGSVDMDNAGKELEYNMIYTEEGVVGSFAVAHEALHAYSAMDLYNVGNTPEGAAAEKRTTKRFPKEVMMTAVDDAEESELSEVTAFLIGWHDKPKHWYTTLMQPGAVEPMAFLLKNHKNFDENGDIRIEDEEELAKYKYKGGELVRLKINGSDDFIHWKHSDSDSEEETEYWEDSSDDDFYYLTDKKSRKEISLPKEDGTCFQMDESGEFQPWFEVKIV